MLVIVIFIGKIALIITNHLVGLTDEQGILVPMLG
jgi:hypothetical protein